MEEEDVEEIDQDLKTIKERVRNHRERINNNENTIERHSKVINSNRKRITSVDDDTKHNRRKLEQINGAIKFIAFFTGGGLAVGLIELFLHTGGLLTSMLVIPTLAYLLAVTKGFSLKGAIASIPLLMARKRDKDNDD